MIEVYFMDLDGKPVFPLSATVLAVPAKGDRISYWDSGNPNTGGMGMQAEVDHVLHQITRGRGDHVIRIVLKDVRTVDAEGNLFPPA